MTLDDIPLKPCPFCGGAARFDGWPPDCIACGADAAFVENTASSFDHEGQMRRAQAMAELWNRRKETGE